MSEPSCWSCLAATRPANAAGAEPDAVTWSADGRRAYAALAGDDAVAVIDTASSSPKVEGYVPTGWYPTAIQIGPTDGRIYTVAAKGLGSRYLPGMVGYTSAPGKSLPEGASIPGSDYYDSENMPGLLTRFTVPSSAALRSYSATAADDILHAARLDQRPRVSPVPAVPGPPSPIIHVVYIVRDRKGTRLVTFCGPRGRK